jgi:hypothetical protein
MVSRREQRRDHKPRPFVGFACYNIPDDGVVDCLDCGEKAQLVYHRSGTYYWRHIRRWYKKP